PTHPPHSAILSLSLHDALPICAWCRANGEYELTKNHFGMRLRDRGFTPTRLGNERAWEGIGLAPEPDSQEAILARLRDIQDRARSEEHTSELQSPDHLVCRLLL